MEDKKKNTEEKISKDLKELVIARLDVLPKDKKISIGSSGEFTTEELILRVRKGDEIGKKIIKLELEFLKALKDGILLKELLELQEV